jgi:F-box interacting protein
MALCYFPMEIISEILLRLPVKSLVRFTCVCKSWFSIISSCSFAFAHLSPTNRSHNNHIDDRLLLLTISCKTNDRHRYVTTVITAWFGKQVIEEQELSTKSFNEHEELKLSYRSLKHFDLVGCSNGLVLIKHYVDTLLLWNPLLRKFVTLPKPDNIGYEEELQVHSIGWGFGFDSRTNDYKAVKIVCLENNGGVKLDSLVQVFSLATRCWKSFRVGVPACSLTLRGQPPVTNGPIDRIISRRPQPFINGAIHWLASGIGSDVRRHFVLSFDISSEIFREIMLPDKIAFLSSLSLFISVYEKSLTACVASPYLRSLWVMKEYGAIESWTQVLIEQNIREPLGFTTRGEVLWQTNNIGEVASYDPKSPKIMNRSVDDKGTYCFAGPYEESLALLYEANLSRKRWGKKGNTIGTKQERVTDCLEHAKKSVRKKSKTREE